MNGNRLFKPYTTNLYEPKNSYKQTYDTLLDVKFEKFTDRAGNVLAWMWYGISRFEKQIPSINPMRGIQSLLDSGMSEDEVQALFPEIDFSTALEQIASIQAFLNNREIELPGLTAMFGEALPEELLTIATDLDMTGAQSRWDEFAANPGAITTDAISNLLMVSCLWV